MRTWRWATASAPSSMLCVLPSARSGRGHAAHRNRTGGRGVRIEPGRCGSDSCVVKFQSCANTDISCVTMGPSRRKCVSALVSAPDSAVTKAARTFMPPVKPTRPSTTSILRWLRRLAGHAQHAQRIGHEARHRHAAARQHAHDGRARIARADGVDQHAHLHAAPVRFDQRLRHLAADGVVVEDIALHRHRVAGVTDRLQHGRVGFVAAGQRQDRIAPAAGNG